LLSAGEARRVALAAQGFAGERPSSPAAHDVRRAIDRLSLLQIDSVNVLVRSHYLPLFSRLGPYDVALLERAAYAGRRRSLFEYWGHEASLMPVSLYPLLRWRMERAARGVGIYGGLARWARRHRKFTEAVLAEVTERGPLSASELSNGGRSRGAWWGWSQGKYALEWLFWAGRVTTATRRRFERVYDLPERVLPPKIIAAPVPAEDEAQRRLLRLAARALGVATERDLADYFRFRVVNMKKRLDELVEAGHLARVTVESWSQPAYLDRTAAMPSRIDAHALLSPFDSLIFERQRTERIFGFHYRIALYTPIAQRTHGYYVLPFLLGDRLVARVDLKADRATGVLRVLAAHTEAGVDPKRIAGPLTEEIAAMATWLGLERVHVAPRGLLCRALRGT
jgi:hypothetical protein